MESPGTKKKKQKAKVASKQIQTREVEKRKQDLFEKTMDTTIQKNVARMEKDKLISAANVRKLSGLDDGRRQTLEQLRARGLRRHRTPH